MPGLFDRDDVQSLAMFGIVGLMVVALMLLAVVGIIVLDGVIDPSCTHAHPH